jgi:hypothetical protein
MAKQPKPKTARTDGGAPTPNQANDFFEEAVREAKGILARRDRDWMRLAELADQVRTDYGDQSLERWAKKVGLGYSTAKRLRSTLRAYTSIGALAPRLYSVAQALQAHPDRDKILKKRPNLTKEDARKEMRAHSKTERVKPSWRPKELEKHLDEHIAEAELNGAAKKAAAREAAQKGFKQLRDQLVQGNDVDTQSSADDRKADIAAAEKETVH